MPACTPLFPESPRSHVLILRISGQLYDVISWVVCRFLPVLRSRIPQDIKNGGDSHIHLKGVVKLQAYLLPVMPNIEKATRCTTLTSYLVSVTQARPVITKPVKAIPTGLTRSTRQTVLQISQMCSHSSLCSGVTSGGGGGGGGGRGRDPPENMSCPPLAPPK